jgi:hypothetical protein
MPETKNEVRVYQVGYVCDQCEKGTMLPKGEAIAMPDGINLHKHVCGHCGAAGTFEHTYPRTVYEVAGRAMEWEPGKGHPKATQ